MTIKVLSIVGQWIFVFIYGVIGILFLIISSVIVGPMFFQNPSVGTAIGLGAIASATVALLSGLYVSIFRCGRRVMKGDLEGARQPTLFMAIWNLVSSLAGLALHLVVLMVLGILLGTMYLVTYWLIMKRVSNRLIPQHL